MRLALICSLAVLGACGPEVPEVVSTSQPIVGGALARTCQWPTTVLLPNAGCSGTLIHPSIIITAAHCGTTEKTAILGETRSAPARVLAIEYCRTFQGENGPSSSDYGFCKLKTPVTDVPIVPILMGCEKDVLKAGQPVVVAGFGETGKGGGFGTKRWVETTIVRVSTRGIQVGGMGKAPCFGDSGGPAFVKLPDGSWRAFGIDSAGLAEACTEGDLMAGMHDAVAWIEQQSKIDVTPCHDADGTWNPSPACRSFATTPDMSGGAWANGCAEPALSPPIATCGAPYGGAAGDGGAVDAGARLDPSVRDAGARIEPAPRDAALPEVAVRRDAARLIPVDAEPSLPPEPTPSPTAHSKGCGCTLGGRSESPGLVLVAVAFSAAVRRRRRQSRTGR